MHAPTRPAATLALILTFAAAMAALTALAPRSHAVQDADARAAADIHALDGDWLYVKDLTEGRAVEDQGPRMSPRITLRVEEDAVVWVRPGGDEPFMIDGSAIEEVRSGATTTRRGAWKDGVVEYVIESVRDEDGARLMLIHREFRITPDGLLIRLVMDDPSQPGSLSLYRHPDDIPLPEPARATIADVSWLAGAWVGTLGSSSIEERWGPPRGVVMLGTSAATRPPSSCSASWAPPAPSSTTPATTRPSASCTSSRTTGPSAPPSASSTAASPRASSSRAKATRPQGLRGERGGAWTSRRRWTGLGSCWPGDWSS